MNTMEIKPKDVTAIPAHDDDTLVEAVVIQMGLSRYVVNAHAYAIMVSQGMAPPLAEVQFLGHPDLGEIEL